MNRKIKKISLLSVLMIGGVMFGLGTAHTEKVEAASGDNTNINMKKPTPWKGASAQMNKLRYGITNNEADAARGVNLGVPNVELIPEGAVVNGKLDESKVIRHLYDFGSYSVAGGYVIKPIVNPTYDRKIGTTPGLTLVATEAENSTARMLYPEDINGGFDKVTVVGDEVNATGTTQGESKATNKKWAMSINMKPNASHSAILHTYTLKNISSAVQTITPIKLVDTQLDQNDYVQIFSRGVGKGLYIETYKDSIPNRKNGSNARLDYIFNPNRASDPLYYTGTGLYRDVAGKDQYPKNVFGPLGGSVPAKVTNDMNATEGTVVYGWKGTGAISQNLDTAIWMSWGQKTIAPSESITMTYEVGMEELSDLDLEKTYENKQPQVAGQNTEGDVITYKVKVASPDYNIKDIVVTDPLSKYFDEPVGSEKIVVTNKAGTKIAEYAMSDVFNKNTNVNEPYVGTLTIPKNGKKPSVTKNDTLYYTYDVKLANGSGGQSITNTAKISAVSEDGRIANGEASTQTSIDVIAANKPPKLNVGNTLVELKYNDVKPTDLLAGVTAKDDEDGPLTNITYSGDVEMGARGQNIITYSVTDSSGLITTATRTYVVGGFVGKTHVLFVEDFVAPATPTGAGESNPILSIKEKSDARVEKLHDTKVVSNIKSDIQVPNLNGYSAKQGIYRPVIKTTIDPSIKGTVVALIGYENNAINGADGPFTEGGIVRMTSLPLIYTSKDGNNLLSLISTTPKRAMSQLVDESKAFAWDSTTRDSITVNSVTGIESLNPRSDLDIIRYQAITGLVHKNTLTIEKTR